MRLVKTMLVAGLAAGVFGWALQMALTTPLIVAAEVYESGGADSAHDHGHDHDAGHDHDHGDAMNQSADAVMDEGHHHDENAWAPADGFERHAFTLLTALLFGVGFSAVLSGVFVMLGEDRIGWRQGMIWGLLGYAALYAAPALGLPPELPGMSAADLDDRQLWWAGTALATAIGLFALFRVESWPVRVVGLLLIAVPHVFGAPHPHEFSDGPPAELAAQFAVASLISVALFWVVLGGAAGWAFDRFAADSNA